VPPRDKRILRDIFGFPFSSDAFGYFWGSAPGEGVIFSSPRTD
jgi:hypothetical protein